MVNHLRGGIANNYEHYSEFWGGNPSEVFSHWLDMVLMSGGAFVIAWLTSIEAFFRCGTQSSRCRLAYFCLISVLIVSGVIAFALDGAHGEGTVIIAYPVFFLPILASSYYLLRQLAALRGWAPKYVIALAVGYVAIHLATQIFYEPSGTGAPNGLVVMVWLGSVGSALLWALGRGIRTGFLKQLAIRMHGIVRRPTV